MRDLCDEDFGTIWDFHSFYKFSAKIEGKYGLYCRCGRALKLMRTLHFLLMQSFFLLLFGTKFWCSDSTQLSGLWFEPHQSFFCVWRLPWLGSSPCMDKHLPHTSVQSSVANLVNASVNIDNELSWVAQLLVESNDSSKNLMSKLVTFQRIPWLSLGLMAKAGTRSSDPFGFLSLLFV